MNTCLHDTSWRCDTGTWMLHGLDGVSVDSADIVVIKGLHAVLLLVVVLRLVMLLHHVLLLHVVTLVVILLDPWLVLHDLDGLLANRHCLSRCAVVRHRLLRLLSLLLLLGHLVKRVEILVLEGCLLGAELGVEVLLLVGIMDVGVEAGGARVVPTRELVVVPLVVPTARPREVVSLHY